VTSSSFDPSGPPHAGIFGLEVLGVEAARVVILAAPWEATTSYGRGTAGAPDAILRASRQVELFDLELGQPWKAGIVMLAADEELRATSAQASAAGERAIEAFERGEPAAAEPDRARVDELTAWLDARLERDARAHIEAGRIVGTVGGDHGAVFGAIAAHARHYRGMGILHFDAHADLRVAYQGFRGSHASIMHRVLDELDGVARLVSVGLRDVSEEEHAAIAGSAGRARAWFDLDLARRLDEGASFGSIAGEIASALPANVYVSFDVDGLDPRLCPHTGTPVPGGLSFHQALSVLRAVTASGRRIVGFDLTEVAPGPDGDEWDANVGARLLYKLIGYTLRSQRLI
jgi:agmatinase